MLKLDFNERSDYQPEWLQKFEFDTSELWQYPDRTELESTIADFYQLKSEQVFCSNGGDESIYILMRIIAEGGRLILPLPAFSQYTWGKQSWKLSTVEIEPNDDLTVNWPAVRQSLQDNPKSVLVVTSPNNPTGESITADELFELLTLAQQNQSWVFMDEAYIEFSEQPSAIKLLNQFDNLVVLRTLSKAFGLAGIRLGYLLGSEKLINEFKQRAMPFNVPAPSLALAKAAFTNDAQADMQNYTAIIKRNREQLRDWLNNQGVQVIPSQANFLLLQLNPLRAELLKQVLKRNEISVRLFSEPQLGGCVRITIPYQLDTLMKVLADVFEPEVICFDMDGVLIDTSQSYDKAIKATVKEFTGVTIGEKDINQLRSLGGFNNDWVLAKALIEQIGKTIELQVVIDCFQQYYLGSEEQPGFIANETLLADETLDRAINKKSLDIAIVTGRPRAEAVLGAENVAKELSVFKSARVISDDDVAESKPSPLGINQLKQKLNYQRSWMIGDTPDDMMAARGSNSVAVGIGTRNQQALVKAGADIVVDSVNQLENIL